MQTLMVLFETMKNMILHLMPDVTGHLPLIIACLGAASLLMVFCSMYPAGNRNSGQQEAFGFCSSKVPPKWSNEWERQYPYDTWEKDVLRWCRGGTELQGHQLGSAIALGLGGEARNYAREIDDDLLVNGRVAGQDPNTGQPINIPGYLCLLELLRAKFGMLPQEQTIHAVAEFFKFTKQHGESIDEAISRFEILKFRAENTGRVRVNEVVISWLMLTSMRIPMQAWSVLLAATQGNLPSTLAELQSFVNYLRRNGHLYEKNPNNLSAANTYFQDSAGYDDSDFFDAWDGSSWHDAASYYGSADYDDLESESSCMSDNTEPVDFSDVAMLDINQAGETIYLAHRMAKRRWRRFQGGQRRFRRRSGKGKKGFGGKFGSGKSGRFRPKGKGKGIFAEWQTPEEWQIPEQVYQTTTRRQNPLGPDGKPLRCSICDSTEHFRAKCPKKPATYAVTSTMHHDSETDHAMQMQSLFAAEQTQAITHQQHQQQPALTNASRSGHPWHGFTTVDMTGQAPKVPSDSDSSAPSVSRLLVPTVPRFMTELQPPPEDFRFHSAASWSPKTPAPTSPPNLAGMSSSSSSNSGGKEWWRAFTWWVTGTLGQSYHTAVQLEGKSEGIMIDTGAIDNLTGDGILKRLTKLLKAINRTVIIKPLAAVLGVSGVGQNSSECSTSATVYGELADGSQITYCAPVIAGSEIPALLGLKSLQRQRSLVDVYNRKLYLVGPGGYTINLSPGSVTYDLHEAPTGHLMLPITCYLDRNPHSKPNETKKNL